MLEIIHAFLKSFESLGNNTLGNTLSFLGTHFFSWMWIPIKSVVTSIDKASSMKNSATMLTVVKNWSAKTVKQWPSPPCLRKRLMWQSITKSIHMALPSWTTISPTECSVRIWWLSDPTTDRWGWCRKWATSEPLNAQIPPTQTTVETISPGRVKFSES